MYKKFIKDNAIVKDSRITAAWKAETEMLRRKLTKYEKSQIANNVLNSYGHGSGGKPGFTKTRHFKEVPPEMRKYYDSFEKTSIQYITQMTDAVNLHKWLGVGLTKNRLREVVEEVEVAPGVVTNSARQWNAMDSPKRRKTTSPISFTPDTPRRWGVPPPNG